MSATRGHEVRGFDALLVFRLARQPVWLLGFACMIAGFAFQVSALHFGPLALVQPILAVELLFVFGYLALRTRAEGARWREWAAAVAMSAGISVFLRAAAPTGGREHAPASLWWLSGLATLAAVAVAVAASAAGQPPRRAACLGIATGIAWGFVAAVIKELSSHVVRRARRDLHQLVGLRAHGRRRRRHAARPRTRWPRARSRRRSPGSRSATR